MVRRYSEDEVKEIKETAIKGCIDSFNRGRDGLTAPTWQANFSFDLYWSGLDAHRNAKRLADIDAAEAERKRIAEIEDIARRVIATEKPTIEHTLNDDLVVTVQVDPECVAEIAALIREATST
jgi:hypothetical protein